MIWYWNERLKTPHLYTIELFSSGRNEKHLCCWWIRLQAWGFENPVLEVCYVSLIYTARNSSKEVLRQRDEYSISEYVACEEIFNVISITMGTSWTLCNESLLGINDRNVEISASTYSIMYSSLITRIAIVIGSEFMHLARLRLLLFP